MEVPMLLSPNVDPSFILLRNPSASKGAGFWYKRTAPAEFEKAGTLITGGKINDPKKYGGITPPGLYAITEAIMLRRVPSRKHKMRFARFVPLGDQRATHRLRTWALDGYPFMLHVAGTSTGCVAVHVSTFKTFTNYVNAELKDGRSSFVVYDATEFPTTISLAATTFPSSAPAAVASKKGDIQALLKTL